MPRGIGPTQRAILSSMVKHHGGVWSCHAGWMWDTPSGTLLLMESLRRRGLVTTRRADRLWNGFQPFDEYVVTEAGRQAVA